MTKKEYLSSLSRELRHLDADDRADALEYYREYFDEAGAEKEQEVVGELGAPHRLAALIRAELVFRQAEESPKSLKKGLCAALTGIGAVFAAPIAIPLALGLAVLAVLLVLSLALLLLSFFVVGIALGLCGLALLALAVCIMLQSPVTALATVGCGLALLGLGGLVFLPTLRLSRWSFRRFAAFLRRKLRRPSLAQS